MTSWRPLRVVWYHWTVDVLSPPFSPLFLLFFLNRPSTKWNDSGRKHKTEWFRRSEEKMYSIILHSDWMRFVYWMVFSFSCLFYWIWKHSITISFDSCIFSFSTCLFVWTMSFWWFSCSQLFPSFNNIKSDTHRKKELYTHTHWSYTWTSLVLIGILIKRQFKTVWWWQNTHYNDNRQRKVNTHSQHDNCHSVLFWIECEKIGNTHIVNCYWMRFKWR